MPVFSSDLVQGPATRRRTAGWGTLGAPLSQPDRDYLENKVGELQAPGYISDDYARATHLLGQDDRLTKGQRAIAGPATLALSRSSGIGTPAGRGGGPGEVPDATAMNAYLADPTQSFNKLALDDAVQMRQERARMLNQPSPDLELFQGLTGKRAQAQGDIAREQFLQDATARGTGQANEYLAPGQADARRQRLWDDEKRWQTQAPFLPQSITGGYNLQRELAKGQAGLAGDQIQADARTNAAVANAIRGLIASGAIANTPEVQNALIQQGLGIVTGGNQGNPVTPQVAMPPGPQRQPQPVMPSSGFMPGPQGNQPGGFNPAPNFNQEALRPFPRAQLAEYARQYGMTEQMAEEYLRRFQGYQVQ